MSTSQLHKKFIDLAKLVVYVMQLNNTPTPYLLVPTINDTTMAQLRAYRTGMTLDQPTMGS
jgi:hypothetical protein